MNTHVVTPTWYAKPIPRALLAVALSTCLGTLSLPATAQVQPASAQVQRWQLPAGRLAAALDQLGTQSRLQIVYSPELLGGLTTPGLSGEYTPAEALRRLLDGTGIAIDTLDETTFVLRRAGVDESTRVLPSVREDVAREGSPAGRSQVTDLAVVAVTGTRIRGVPPSSPLVMITSEEMRLSGHSNLGEVIRALPQNFSGGQNPGVAGGATGGIANQNITGASSLNLRGLGPDATITLLNGARMAYDGFSQATDVAIVPVSAVERMEVLLDGASAIYGSDAVGGVANIILRKDYHGAEVSARYGQATAGGYEQKKVSAMAGQNWQSGNILIAAESSSSGNVLASQRDYLDYVPSPDLLAIYPKISQDGVLISGHQQIGSAEFSLDAFHTKRFMRLPTLFTPLALDYDVGTEVHGISPAFVMPLNLHWSLRVSAFLGEDRARTDSPVYLLSTGALVSRSSVKYSNLAKSAGVEVEGPLFQAPAGNARVSVGGGWRRSEYDETNLITAIPATGGYNTSRYLFGEMSVPLVAADQEVPFVESLAINGAIRYEDYDRFDGTSSPKVGVVWDISSELSFRASWGRSFKAPTALQQFQGRFVQLRTAAALGLSNLPSTTTVLTTSGGNVGLAPERARVTTAGLTFRPQFLPDASIEIGWFDIDYSQRVVQPFVAFNSFLQFGQALTDPAYADFIIGNPTPQQQDEIVRAAQRFTNQTPTPYNPANVVAVFQNHYVNASQQVVRGVDADARYSFSSEHGMWQFSLGGSWITDSWRKNMESAPSFSTAGAVGFPPRFKGRLGVSWGLGEVTVSALINHLAGLKDTRLIPQQRVSSMTTLDLVLDQSWSNGWMPGIGFNISILNALDKHPPALRPLQSYYVNYDSTNYSALGRVISLEVVKKF